MQASRGNSPSRTDPKSRVRAEVLARRDALTPAEIADRSRLAGERLFSTCEVAAARIVMFFLAFGSEIHTLPMIERALAEGKRVAAPRPDPKARSLAPAEVTDPGSHLVPGTYGILEPAPDCPAVEPGSLDVIVVPAAVWAEDGYRIGYGAGYYDRFLSCTPRAVWVGLGLELQVVPEVPHDDHDLPVDLLVTDAVVRRFTYRSGARG